MTKLTKLTNKSNIHSNHSNGQKQQQQQHQQQQHQQQQQQQKQLIEVDSDDYDLPTDRYSMVYLMFLLLGIGTLLPWNVFINAKDYFENYKLNTTKSMTADYRINFMNYLGLAGQLPNMVMTAFNAFYQPIRMQAVTRNATVRVLCVIAIEICICCLTIVLAILDTSDYPKHFFTITIVSAAVLSSCTGIYQSNVFATAAMLPMQYSSALVLGTNVCGTLISTVNIICKALATKNPQLTAQLYFAFAVLLLLLCLSSMLLLPRMTFFKSHTSASTRHQAKLFLEIVTTASMGSLSRSQLMRAARHKCPENGDCADPDALALTRSDLVAKETSYCSTVCDTFSDCFGCCCVVKGRSRREAFDSYWQRYISSLKDCWSHCVSVWCVFFCSLCCFPAILSSVRPVQLLDLSDWFVDIFVFLLFNFGAMLGSLLSRWVQYPTPRWLSLFVWLRVFLFIPFFTLCNCFPNNRISGYPVLVNNDYVFILGVFLFAFSSGHFSSLCMMYAPSCLRDKSHAGVAAMIATFCLVLGIFCGISFGGVLFNLIQK